MPTHEQAFAEALARDACDGDVAARFMATLERACAYFGAEERDGNGIFTDYATLQSDLERTLEAARRALSARQERPVNWRDVLIRSIPGHAHTETTELLYGIVLELYPDIVERHETRLQIAGSAILDPDMKASELAAILTRDYAWALEMAAEVSCDRFWYYPQESPYEPRRGVRASARAGSSCVGWVKVEGAAPSPLLFAMPLPAAVRGNVVAVADSASGKLHLAGPGRAGPWIATVDGLTPAWTSDQGAAALSSASDAIVSMGRLVFPATVRDAEATPVLYVACLRLLEAPASIEDCARALLDEMQADTARMLASETVRDLRHNMIRNGVTAASMESLLPDEVEKQIAIPA